MGLYRSLVALFGALPATVLGSLALGVTFGGLRMLISAELSGGLFLIWGALGLAGVAGLWLAVLEGPHSRGAAFLIACGLIADAVLIALTVRGGLYGSADASPTRSASSTTIETVYCLLAVCPFVVGTLYVARRLTSRRQAPVL